MSEQINNTYTNDSITSFGDEIESIRNKPASIGIENHNHLFTEILANAIDETREGYGNIIQVTKNEDKSIEIQDFGRGIPLGKNSDGEYVYKKVLTKLWSGGKMDNTTNNGEYEYSLGTNGCGLKATNFCSDFLECTSYRDKKKYFIRYEKGRQAMELQESKDNNDITGTTIHYLPSADIFRSGYDTDVEFIETMLQQQSIVNKGLKLIFNNKIDNVVKEYYYENGLIDYIEEYGTDENKVNTNIIDVKYFTTETQGKDKIRSSDNDTENEKFHKEYKIKCNVAFTFNNDKQLLDFYHNGSYLVNGGTPNNFIQNGFVYAINKYIEEKRLNIKGDRKIKYDDIKDSLILITDTYSTISIYTDQAKKQIDSELMNSYMTSYLKEQLAIYFIENEVEAKQICNVILNNMRANVKADKTKLDIRKKLTALQTSTVKIDGLKDCDMSNDNVDDRWLLVVEGKSPQATVVDAYDNTCMGALGLRGRFISCLKTTVSKVLNNAPAYTLIQALGCGIEIPSEERKAFKDIKSFDASKLRYGNIGILTDADCWGSGIRLALLTFMYKYLPTLLKENRVYIIISPRYEIKMKNGDMKYVYNDREKEEFMKTVDETTIEHIGIIKGLGEMNKDDFWDKVLSPEAREKTFIQVDYNETDKIVNKYFEDYMGDDTQPRKDFVKEFITNVKLDEIN